MLITGLMILILSNAVTLRRDKSIFYAKTGMVITILCLIIAFNNFNSSFLDQGIELYGGFFTLSIMSHMFHIFIFAVSFIILQLNSFYPRKIWTKHYSSISNLLFNIRLKFLFEPYKLYSFIYIFMFMTFVGVRLIMGVHFELCSASFDLQGRWNLFIFLFNECLISFKYMSIEISNFLVSHLMSLNNLLIPYFSNLDHIEQNIFKQELFCTDLELEFTECKYQSTEYFSVCISKILDKYAGPIFIWLYKLIVGIVFHFEGAHQYAAAEGPYDFHINNTLLLDKVTSLFMESSEGSAEQAVGGQGSGRTQPAATSTTGTPAVETGAAGAGSADSSVESLQQQFLSKSYPQGAELQDILWDHTTEEVPDHKKGEIARIVLHKRSLLFELFKDDPKSKLNWLTRKPEYSSLQPNESEMLSKFHGWREMSDVDRNKTKMLIHSSKIIMDSEFSQDQDAYLFQGKQQGPAMPLWHQISGIVFRKSHYDNIQNW